MPAKGETKFTPEIGETLCKIIRRGNFRVMACAQVGISVDTLCHWLKRGAQGEEPFEQLGRDILKAEAESEDLVITGIRRHGAQDWRALAWIAEKAYSERWGYRAQLKANLQDMVQREAKRILTLVEKYAGQDVATQILADLADEESSEGASAGNPAAPSTGAGPNSSGRGVH